MTHPSTFAEAVEVVDELSVDDQEALIELLRRRLAARGRRRIIKEVRQAQDDYKAGRCKPTTVDELMREITS